MAIKPDLRPLGREPEGGGAPDAAAGSGHDGAAACESIGEDAHPDPRSDIVPSSVHYRDIAACLN